MDAQENASERQVWQRVFSPAEQPGSDLRSLRMGAMELAAAYRSLQEILPGKQKEAARRLYEGELANSAALKGIQQLSGQAEELLKIWNPAREPGRKLLERCYFQTRRAMVAYMGRSAEPEFGVVFRALADREARHCLELTQLLGGWKNG